MALPALTVYDTDEHRERNRKPALQTQSRFALSVLHLTTVT